MLLPSGSLIHQMVGSCEQGSESLVPFAAAGLAAQHDESLHQCFLKSPKHEIHARRHLAYSQIPGDSLPDVSVDAGRAPPASKSSGTSRTLALSDQPCLRRALQAALCLQFAPMRLSSSMTGPPIRYAAVCKALPSFVQVDGPTASTYQPILTASHSLTPHPQLKVILHMDWCSGLRHCSPHVHIRCNGQFAVAADAQHTAAPAQTLTAIIHCSWRSCRGMQAFLTI